MPLVVAAQAPPPPLRDSSYTSPTWGYSVRWYGDDWSVDEESSENGVDSLWLSDDAGSVVGFQGGYGYDGNASLCLDDVSAVIANDPSAHDVVTVRDEGGNEQEFRHPWRSWSLLLVTFDDGEPIDYVVYLDCRTLSPGEATLFRYLESPAATFEENFEHFDILAAAMPRQAWLPSAIGFFWSPGWDNPSPLPADHTSTYYPSGPYLLIDEAAREFGAMTVVDGDESTRVVTIENSGTRPLTIDPARFAIVRGHEPNPATDVGPGVTWQDTRDSAPRTLAPGTWATVQVAIPGELAAESCASLHYRDTKMADGDVRLLYMGPCGGAGGSRPKLRISR
jgi:hypothetical protein